MEDLAVCIAGCGAEHLLGARTPKTAKASDRKRARKLLSQLSESVSRAAMAEAYRLADEKLTAHEDDVRKIADEFLHKWRVPDHTVRIERDELIELRR